MIPIYSTTVLYDRLVDTSFYPKVLFHPKVTGVGLFQDNSTRFWPNCFFFTFFVAATQSKGSTVVTMFVRCNNNSFKVQ